MKTNIIFLFTCVLFFTSCSSGYIGTGVGYDRGTFGQGTFNPRTQTGRGFYAEVGGILNEKNIIGLNAGWTGYSDNFDGEPTLYANLLYARLFPISSNKFNIVVGGELGKGGFSGFDNMVALRFGFTYDIPLIEERNTFLRLSFLDRPQYLFTRNTEFNNNLGFSVGLLF